ncbi:MAG: ABC transporter ATP-binding protein [Candidatus Eisenbacteria bacterium]
MTNDSPHSHPIEASHLVKTYGPVRAVDDVSFAVHRGEILGLLGPNGAGKSTTLRMLVGFQYPDAGVVRLQGRDVYREGAEARSRLGYMPEALPLYAEMTVRAYLRYFASLKGVADSGAAIDRVVQHLSLEDVIQRPCGNLSRGYRQRVGLAQALLADPSVLVLDEPTSGLDPNQIHDFRSLIRSLGQERSVLLSTHILPEALEICDRLVILSRGRVVAEGRPQELAGTGSGLHWVRLRAESPIAPEHRERFGLEPEGGERDAAAGDAASGDAAAGDAAPGDAASDDAASGDAAPGDAPRSGVRGDGARGDGAQVYCVRRDLSGEDARALLALVSQNGWDLLEWQTGAAGLEAVFRRLTLGGE